MTREPHQLAEAAWGLVDEAVDSGKMTLRNGNIITLNADSLIRLIQWLATTKARKPHTINTPEDFDLKETSGGDGDD